MTPAVYQRAKEIFLEVCDLTAAERPAALDQRCAGEPELRAAVLDLLEGDAGPVDLDQAVERVRDHIDGLAAEPPPRVRGYRVLERIGEDEAGIVYHARRLAPGKRDVALKVARNRVKFDAEKQAEEARLLDSGLTTDGRPFFALDLAPQR